MLEEITNQQACARVDDDCIRLCHRLQTGSDIGCLPNARLLLGRANANQAPDDHQSGGNPDPDLRLNTFDLEPTDSFDDAQPRPHSSLGVVFMRLRIAEIGQDAVARVLGDEAVELADHVSHDAVIRGNDFA